MGGGFCFFEVRIWIGEEGQTYIDGEQPLNLLFCEIQRRLVVRDPSITNYAVQGSLFENDFIHGGLNLVFVPDIRRQ